MKKDSWQEDDYKLLPEFYKHHEVPVRLLDKSNKLDYRILHYQLLSEYNLTKFLSNHLYFFYYRLIVYILAYQNFSEEFYRKNYNIFQKALANKLSPEHYLMCNISLPWINNLNLNITQLQIDIYNGWNLTNFPNQTKEFLEYIKLTTL